MHNPETQAAMYTYIYTIFNFVLIVVLIKPLRRLLTTPCAQIVNMNNTRARIVLEHIRRLISQFIIQLNLYVFNFLN
jgi:hypothetical protein